MRALPQQDHADLGLETYADHTEDLRKESALGGVGAPTRAIEPKPNR